MVLVVMNPPASIGRDVGSIPGLERSLEEGTATHSSILAWRIPMDRGAWMARIHRVPESQGRLKQLSTDAGKAMGTTKYC